MKNNLNIYRYQLKMRKWKVNSYVLSVCLLISEYVRQQQQDVKPGEDSIASMAGEALEQAVPSNITKTSLNALARFLSQEIQHPMIINPQNSPTGFTTLQNLLRRLKIGLDNVHDFEQLSWQVVSILTQIKSPDTVCNVVEQISECVAPLQSVPDGGEDMDTNYTNSMLVRSSSLGFFVRGFLLEINRLLFDGLSRLLDDVEEYLKQFRKDVETGTKLEIDASQNLWNECKSNEDELLLSPIYSSIAMKPDSTRRNVLSTILAPNFDTEMPSRILLTSEAALEVNDPEVWSNEQLNFILTDTIKGTRGRKRRFKDQLIEEELQLLRTKMDGLNPNVLFAKYLSFLNDRNYQGALDSLHQYHDVLSPRRNGDIAPSGVSEMHFRGSGVQYAALNLAGLQILFDHYTAAEESIQEAIRVAQHHGDHICVAFALAWLIRTNQKIGQSKEAILKLICSCLDRAHELCLPSLQVLATLTEFESEFLRGTAPKAETAEMASQYIPHRIAAHTPAPRPLHIWLRLQETIQSIASIATPNASITNTSTRTMMAMQMRGIGHSEAKNSAKCGGIGLDWIKSAEALLDTVWELSGQVTIFAAVAWKLFGHFSLAQVFNRIHLVCYEDYASTGEIALTVSQMAMSKLTQSKDGANVYEQALYFLVDIAASDKYSVQRHHLFENMVYQRATHRLFFFWAMQRGEFARAQVHLEAVLALSPKEKDTPMYLEALLLEALIKNAVGDNLQSFKFLARLESTCNKHGFTYLHAQVLIATSRTRLKASAPHAPFSSLNTLLKTIDICTSHHYDLLLVEAHVLMAETLLAMGKLQDAHSLISNHMPFVMEHGSVDIRGECFLLLAKIMIASIKRSEGAKKPAYAASKAIKMLSASAELFASVQNLRRLKEVSYMQSLVYNHMAIQAEMCDEEPSLFATKREEAAERFIKHSAQLKKAAFYTIESFFDVEYPEKVRQVIAHRSSEL